MILPSGEKLATNRRCIRVAGMSNDAFSPAFRSIRFRYAAFSSARKGPGLAGVTTAGRAGSVSVRYGPKSNTFTSPSEVTMMLEGFRSR